MRNIIGIDKSILKSLSKRLEFLSLNNNAYSDPAHYTIKADNLQMNLSGIIAKIILNLQFPNYSIEIFENITSQYNQKHNTNLSIKDYLSINWIRIVDQEVLIPEVVRSFIINMGKEEDPIEIPESKEDLSYCLQQYYQQYYSNRRFTIKTDTLQRILEQNSTDSAKVIDFLGEKNIIGYDTINKIHYWEENEYTSYLRNEIVAILWISICGDDANEEQFRRFFKIIRKMKLYFDKIDDYLNPKSVSRLKELALLFLNSEKDLENSDNEFRKMWLDAASYSHKAIHDPIPVFKFDYSNPFNYIKNINYHKSSYIDIFDGSSVRNFSYAILRIITGNPTQYPLPYQEIIPLFKDMSRPSVIVNLYFLLSRQSTQIIPYLLTDNDLIPIAFDLLYEARFDNMAFSDEMNYTKKEERICEVRNELWLEMFGYILSCFTTDNQDTVYRAEAIAKVLLDLSRKVFSNNQNDSRAIIRHNAYRKLYDAALKLFCEYRNKNTRHYGGIQFIYPRIIYSTIPYIIGYLIHEIGTDHPSYSEFLKLRSPLVDLSVEIIRTSQTRIQTDELSMEEETNFLNYSKQLTESLQQYLSRFYTQEKIEVLQCTETGESQMKPIKRGITEFGFEIIDWGYLFLHLEKYQLLDIQHHDFISALAFNTNADKYDSLNKEQSEKIQLYLKALMLGFLIINQKKDFFEIEGLPVADTLNKTESWIKELSLKYSTDDLSNGKMDAFDESFDFGHNMYTQYLTTLLYECINYFSDQQTDPFISEFFLVNTNLGRMLRAINIIESPKYRDLISQKISSAEVDDFIKNSFTTTILQNALVDAINSKEHWKLAIPLIGKIDEHYKKIKQRYDDIDTFLYEVNLLLAFKEKDFEKLLKTELPEREYRLTYDDKHTELKVYYTALNHLYNNKDYDAAIRVLKPLLDNAPHNIRYALYLYTAKTLKAIETKSNKALLTEANQEWDDLAKNLDNEQNKELIKYQQTILSNKLYYHAALEDAVKFDQTLNTLSKPFLYEEQLIPVIYNFYINRSLHKLSFAYINDAKEYLHFHNIPIPPEIQSLIDNSEDKDLLLDLKKSMESIRCLEAKSIPHITPQILNDKRNLGEFILCEFVHASKVMRDKIHGIKNVNDEDRYNDLFMAILRLRFPVWGWSIHDQARKGTSPTGKSAGETDITIEAAGDTIALIEAFIATGKNKSNTQSHVLKSFGYNGYLERYYMLVYFRGTPSSFDTTWDSYKEDAATCSFKPNHAFDSVRAFADLSAKFNDINHLRIARSFHGTNIEMYHIMIDLSE